ncbi:MAG: LamG-like jellyroll fold domain-containing protein [Candidatus Paceibacterota bacterium]|jgi:prepilin-type N-terminal cleavage/methylation domain-containing protein
MNFSKSHKGFTLIELLIVIGIVAVLAVVVLTVLNPVEFLKKSRDSRRMVDLQTLDKALRLADFDNISMGTANVVYVSIPDDTAATSTCPTLGLPALPGGWTYQCSNTANYRKADGTGWVPVNFTTLTTAPNPLTLLPVDPTNSTSTNLYYSYVSGSWELTALFETTNYQTKYAAADNGTSTVLLEVGNHLKITPNAIASRTNTGGWTPTVVVPTLTTNVATNVSSTSATLNGSITNEGNASSTITGFDYGLTTGYGSQTTSTYSGGTGSFSNAISGLSGLNTYHFRAKSYNSAGWGYGGDATLTTADSYTKLLLHMDGANGSQTFTDETGKTVTVNGNAQITTAQKEFGTGSGVFDGTGDYLTLANNNDWNFGTGDFTIDFWLKRDGAQTGNDGLVSTATYPALTGWMIVWQDGATTKIGLASRASGSWNPNELTSSSTIPDLTWVHVALVRYGNVLTMYFNGASVASRDCTGYNYNSSGLGLNIYSFTALDVNSKGWIDEVRVSKGVARWTSNFTPPTAPY